MSIPQADIDHILRMEGNADYARMKIATEFSKGKSVEEIAAFLQSSFHGGNGVVTENGRYSAWYAEDGIHIANGDAARYLTSAKVVSWQEAAERIGQLLTQGEYAANVELAEAPGHERAELAQSIWYLRQDLSEKARAQGYLSCLSDMRGGGFPEETARLAERLRDPAFREVLMDDLAQLRSDYREDRSLLRFHYHKPDSIEQGLRELSLPRREYRTEMAEIPAVQRFITEDEIAATLTRGSNIEGSKGHLTEQWSGEFLRLYPSANILVATKKDFEPKNRKKFCARIATGEYDAVIIGHSQFERIPISPERQERLLHQQIEEITDGIQDTKLAGGNSFTIKSLERTKKGLEARLKKLQASDRKDDVIYFEQLGVDRMFVDESDNYKNLFLYTKMRNVAGLSTTDAQKSSDMFSKCRYMDELTGGRGVVFATGTPVSNSMTELYTIQRYLQHDRLREMGMGHFDCWASRFGETTTALELAPEGTGYRARTRFAKFFNLPELMNLFKEVADIKTADQLHLPTPEVAYHTIATKPTQIQQDMVKALSERASKVHSGAVSPDVDNMLKITSDGRKLGLDQRIINPMLPDEETTKVNQCVANILQYWRDGEEEKLTQLVFCDISTPKSTPSQRAAKASPGTLDSPEIHALESAISLEESAETPFTVYEDVRQKLIDAGMPPEQIAFIHDANTEVKKRELFAKVRSGQVRVLMGSTAKMGAGTNVQDRLVALHDLDCPWRPRDLTQRKGRIERQGNQNKLVHVCRYVTEGTFDAYLWQTVENKQKFISQIMTSKSPVRSCEDVDATALSFAEIKALCAGDPRIKERMDLDIEVSKLKIMKADHNSKQFRLEDSLLKYFPEKIEEHKGFVRGLEADMQTLAAHPLPAEGFVGMEIRGDRLTDKENAGAALLDTCKEVKGKDPVQIGSYRGFTMSVAFDSMWKTYTLTLKGRMTHRVELGSDARGNLVRIENALDKMPERLRSVQEQLENLYNQQAAAKAEVGKPFPQEQELAAKTARLIELDMELNLDGKGQPQPEQAIAKSARPSVLDRLKASPVHGAPEKPHKKEMEAR